MGQWDDLFDRDEVKNEGLPQFTTSHFVDLLNDHVLKYKPDTCFIMGGINDIRFGVTTDRTFANYQSIIDTLISHKITPVIESTLYTSHDSLNIKVDALNAYLVELSHRKNVKFVDLNSVLSYNHLIKPEYTIDGVHLKPVAYRAWYKKLISER